jgi:hypothetical protein
MNAAVASTARSLTAAAIVRHAAPRLNAWRTGSPVWISPIADRAAEAGKQSPRAPGGSPPGDSSRDRFVSRGLAAASRAASGAPPTVAKPGMMVLNGRRARSNEIRMAGIEAEAGAAVVERNAGSRHGWRGWVAIRSPITPSRPSTRRPAALVRLRQGNDQGFNASGANPDSIQLSKSAFSYLPAGGDGRRPWRPCLTTAAPRAHLD